MLHQVGLVSFIYGQDIGPGSLSKEMLVDWTMTIQDSLSPIKQDYLGN